MTVAVKAATDLGLKRSQNEDSHGVWVPDDPAVRARRGVLVVVADGMGGSRAGEVASRLAVEAVMNTWREAPGVDMVRELHGAVEAANRVVHAESVTHPDLGGMGTTVTALVVRDRGIEQLTRDHSLVAQLVRDHQLTAAQARIDPRRNVVTRSVGIGPEVEIDAEQVPRVLRDGDTLLLCSDGLHGLVTDDELCAGISGAPLERACQDLIELAKHRGGHDNITVVLARVELPHTTDVVDSSSSERVARTRSSQSTLTLLILALVVLFLTLGAIGWLVARLSHDTKTLGAGLQPGAAPEDASWA